MAHGRVGKGESGERESRERESGEGESGEGGAGTRGFLLDARSRRRDVFTDRLENKYYPSAKHV